MTVFTNTTGVQIAASSNGSAAVAACVFSTGTISLWKYAPSAIGDWENREEFKRLYHRAVEKLGYQRDRRYKSGWRKVA